MNNEFLTWLKENPSVSYIYNHGSIVYKTNTKDSDIDFLVVVKDDFQIPKQYKKYKYPHHFNRSIKFNVKHENHDFIFFKIDEWFNRVMNNDIYAWECACLNRKFIHKEHVKLLLSTNLIQLRTNFDKNYNSKYKKVLRAIGNNHNDVAIKILWYILKDAVFTLQIIENHKIVNYTSANEYLYKLKESEDFLTEFSNIYQVLYDQIKNHTDGIIQLNIQRKYANI
jgi:hypothetical protein